MLIPGTYTDIIGAVLLAGVFFLQRSRLKKKSSVTA
jgi:hypothetical protein